MPPQYNPIIRTFGRFRAGLIASLGVDRRAVRPDSRLDDLIPAAERREVWRHLRRQGLRMPALTLTHREQTRTVLGVLKTSASIALALQRWPALLAALPLGLIAYFASRRRAVHFPRHLRTVGELVLSLTSIPEHKGSGYRWTRSEIELKVRLVVAESLGLTLDEVQPEMTLAELAE
jgi:hypothetical protein